MELNARSNANVNAPNENIVQQPIFLYKSGTLIWCELRPAFLQTALVSSANLNYNFLFYVKVSENRCFGLIS